MEKVLPPVDEPRFIGMVANSDAKLRPGEVLLAENLRLVEGRWKLRPGLGALGNLAGRVQGLVFWQTLGGVKTTTAFANGNMYEYDWDAGTWSNIPLGGGVVIDPTATLAFAVSRGRLIVTDRVNKPWMLEKSISGVRTFTVLNEAPVAGGVVIYYDKPFFFDIPALPVSFEWGNEGNPLAGYAAADQVWEFAQTDQGAVVAMASMDGVLVVFKEDSATWVKGAVDEEFRTRANREGISTSEGAVSRRCVIIVDDDVLFMSEQGIRKARGGEYFEVIDERSEEGGAAVVRVLRDLWANVNRTALDRAHAVFDTERRQALFFVPEGVSTQCRRAFVYHVDDRAWSTYTFPFDVTCACMVKDNDGGQHLLIGDVNGTVYRFDDALMSDNGLDISWTLRSRKYGSSTPTVVKRLAEVRINLNKSTPNLSGELAYYVKGAIGGSKAFNYNGTPNGQKRYRRGFNVTAPELGWQLSGTTDDGMIEVLSALTLLTAVGSEATSGA